MNRNDLRAAHGTPAEFDCALLAAMAQGFVTFDELKRASDEYRATFEAAE